MATSGTIEIVEHTVTRPGQAECIVRCLSGTIKIGDIVYGGTLRDGREIALELRVANILRYGRTCDLLDPPHNGLLHFSGVISEEFESAVKMSLFRQNKNSHD
ncbi:MULTISPECIES: hypothetical protein [unclassified Nocardia]|uniref:hypothetical protein n=1 Tax=unclassified Nocardia TaxID=2637762 RepID=UPI0033A7899A